MGNTDHASELRRHAMKIASPAGDVPAVMEQAAAEIDRLTSENSKLHHERESYLAQFDGLCDQLSKAGEDRDALAATVDELRQVMHGIVTPVCDLRTAKTFAYDVLFSSQDPSSILAARDERVRAKALADAAVEFHRIKRQHDARGRADALADHADIVSEAMLRAWQLGQTYWQQADSESWSQNAKSSVTQERFQALVEETRAGIMADVIKESNREK